MIARVLDWLGFGSHGDGGHHGHDHYRRDVHTHGVVDPSIFHLSRSDLCTP